MCSSAFSRKPPAGQGSQLPRTRTTCPPPPGAPVWFGSCSEKFVFQYERPLTVSHEALKTRQGLRKTAGTEKVPRSPLWLAAPPAALEVLMIQSCVVSGSTSDECTWSPGPAVIRRRRR